MESILAEFLASKNVRITNTKRGVWLRTHCPECGTARRKNLSYIIFNDGGFYGKCHRCESTITRSSADYRTSQEKGFKHRDSRETWSKVDKGSWWG